jgi:hypothetical protein
MTQRVSSKPLESALVRFLRASVVQREARHEVPNIKRDPQARGEPVQSQFPSRNIARIGNGSVVVVLELGNLRFRVGGHPEIYRVECFCHISAIFLLYRFGDAVDWSDAPYSWHLVPPEQRGLPQPPATPETRTLLQIILVDAGKNVVRAIRAVTLSPEFSRILADTITKLTREPWIEKTYSVDVADAYVCCPTTGDMVAAAIVRSKGGE